MSEKNYYLGYRISAETILFWKLDFGKYSREETLVFLLFRGGKYSTEESIQGRNYEET